MRRYRDTNYWVTEDAKVFKHYPEKRFTDKNGFEFIRLERFKPMKPSINKMGYSKFCFGHKKQGNNWNIELHRIVAECFLGPCPEGFEVDHINADKSNNHISNLQYLTKEDNIRKGNRVSS